ncbi:SDR family oxidoreductase, partial [Microbulbifer halophilus]
LADWFHVPVWTQLPNRSKPDSMALEKPEHWLFFCDQGERGVRLSALLRARGHRVTEVHRGDGFRADGERITIRPNAPDDMQRLMAHVWTGEPLPSRIVHAWALDHCGEDYSRSQTIGFYSLLYLAQALGEKIEDETVSLTILTSGLADVTGDEQLDPLKGSVLGPAAVIPQEYPSITSVLVDVGGNVSDLSVYAELLSVPAVSGERIALRGAHRWMQDTSPLPLGETSAAPRWREGGAYLIAGGFGGLGMVFAEHLARNYKARLALLGRAELPEREQWAETLAELGDAHPTGIRIRQVQALEALGAEVLPIAVDVTDPASMHSAVARARDRFGSLNGVMHAAGVAGGGIMQRRTAEEAAAVLDPKVRGAQILLEAIAEDSPDIVLLHSSLFAVTGGPGQVDYCGANNALDLMARSYARGGLPVISLNWDGWSEVGMAARAAGAESIRLASSAQHPLLDDFARSGDGGKFTLRLDADRHWIVDEHRMNDMPVMPGTGLLEMALAGFRQLEGGQGPLELRDVLFLSPLTVDSDRGTHVRLLLDTEDEGMHFRVQAQGASGWSDHVRGLVACSAAAPDTRDLQALRGCHPHSESFVGREADLLPQDGWLRLGSRWHSVKRIDASQSEALVELELPREAREDAAEFLLHPALLDLATGLANSHWLERSAAAQARGTFLPFGYRKITVWQAIPPHCFAHSRIASGPRDIDDNLALDVQLLDTDGAVLVAIEGFTLKQVQPEAMRPGSAPSVAVAAAWQANPAGIAPEEGIEAMDRVLAQAGGAQVIVSTRPLSSLLDEIHNPEPVEDTGEERNERPYLGSEFASPRNDLEQAMAAIWEALLGIQPIGIHDNFFELGGDSLLATEIPTRVRTRLGLGMDLALVFKAPTVAQLSELLAAKTWAAGAKDEGVAVAPKEEEREVGTL